MKTKLILALALGLLPTACATPPREAVYAKLESGQYDEAASTAMEHIRKNPERAYEVTGALNVARALSSNQRVRTGGSYSEWSTHFRTVPSGLSEDLALFAVGKREQSAAFWQNWLSQFSSSPLRRDAQHELAYCQVRELLATPIASRQSQFTSFMSQFPDSPYREQLEVLFFDNYVELLRTTPEARELQRFLRIYPASPLRGEVEMRLQTLSNIIRSETRPEGIKHTLTTGNLVLQVRTPSGEEWQETAGTILVRFAPARFGSQYSKQSGNQFLANGTFYEPRPTGGCEMGNMVQGRRTGAWLVWNSGTCPDSLVRRDTADDIVVYGSLNRAFSDPEEILTAFPLAMQAQAFPAGNAATRLVPIPMQRHLLQALVKRHPSIATSRTLQTTLAVLKLVEVAPASGDLKSTYESECRGRSEIACMLAAPDKARAALGRGEPSILLYSTQIRQSCDAGHAPSCHLRTDLERIRTVPSAPQPPPPKPKPLPQIAK